MKHILFTLTLLLLCTSACFSADVKFAWDYTQGIDTAEGFELRLSSVTGGPAVMTQNCPSIVLLECTVPAIPKGNWFATVRAYNTDTVGRNYSGASNELAFTLKASPTNNPTVLRIP
jgi:hypothetical protein